MTQSTLATFASIGDKMQSFWETGERDLSKTRVSRLVDEVRALGLVEEEILSLLAAIPADRLVRSLSEGDLEGVAATLSTPLRRSEGQLVRLALTPYPEALERSILTPREHKKAVETLKAVISDPPASATDHVGVRSQATYYLSRSGAASLSGFLTDAYKEERHPHVLRALAIGEALASDCGALLPEYVEMLRWDNAERDNNLAYMGWWSGERGVTASQAYIDAGDNWTGERTLDWLIDDLMNEKALSCLNLYSANALLKAKEGRPLENRRVRHRLQKALHQLDSSTDDSSPGTRGEYRQLVEAVKTFEDSRWN